MILFRSFLFYLVLLLNAVLPVVSVNILSRAVQKTHRFAARHTHNLARDLRVAFGAVLVNQKQVNLASNTAVVYCKSGAGAVNAGGGNSTNSGSSSSGTSSTGSSTKTASAGNPSGTTVSTPWKVAESHSGSNFFSGWSFFTGSDPTNGIVDYLDGDSAQSNNLTEINSNGNAIMRIETTGTVSSTRKSVRITTNSHYDGGLFILDAVHMPTGCGTWPAFWTNGPNWPAGGEIDIVEGISDYTNNQATIHTNPGCGLSSSNSNTLGITGSIVGGTNCAAAETNNQGCGVRFNSNVSFGAAFNHNGGGAYAMQWDSSGIAIYFWPRDSIPSDVLAGTPLPTSWGQPVAKWGSGSCDTSTFFYQHSAIFDTTLCGDWAGSDWNDSGLPGQAQSCATRTGYSTCEDFVRANGAAFAEAYWEVKSVKIYQNDS